MRSNKINIDMMKQFNKTSILRCIHDCAPISRVEISNKLNLSRPSVSKLVQELIEDGLIHEIASVKGGQGRRPIPLEINPGGHYVLGVELGAAEVTVILCNLKADIINHSRFTIVNQQANHVFDLISATIFNLLNDAGIAKGLILGIGVAMHGPVDPERRLSIFAPHLGWHNVEVGKELELRTGMFTLVECDSKSSGLAEQWFGSGHFETNFITLLVDSGIGAGIVIDGKLYRGAHYFGGAVGHITVCEDGPRCSCGNYGCLEMMSSEPAIVRQVRQRLRLGERSVLETFEKQGQDITPPKIYWAAQQGDVLALEVLRMAGRYLGVGIAQLISILDPHLIVLGGGITRAAEFVIPAIREVIEKRVMGDDSKKIPVLTSTLDENLCPIGGATLIIERVIENSIDL